MTIYQPRIGNVDSAEISVAELIERAETYVKPKAIEAAGPDGELVPGEHCRFCKAKAVCKASVKEYNELREMLKLSYDQHELSTGIPHIPNEQLK